MEKIKNLKISSNAQFKCCVSKITESSTKKGEPYVSIVFRDDSAEISYNMWNTTRDKSNFLLNKLYLITGAIDSYQNTLQLKSITNIETIEGSIADFFRKTTFSIEDMYSELCNSYISKIKNPYIKYLLEYLVVKRKNDFCQSPAASKVHHAWIGGLLEHVLGLCRMAKSLYESHYHLYFPNMDMDKVYFGVIAHDWGKIIEYDSLNPSFNTTLSGTLLHHTGIVIEVLSSLRYQYKQNESKLPDDFRQTDEELRHIIYSHHGAIEHQALVRPATQEALFVHLLDSIDAKMMHMHETMLTTGDIEGMTKKSFCHNTSYLKK